MKVDDDVEGEGYKELADKLIHLGAKYGDIQTSEVLPSSRTLSRHVDNICSKEKLSLLSCKLHGRIILHLSFTDQ